MDSFHTPTRKQPGTSTLVLVTVLLAISSLIAWAALSIPERKSLRSLNGTILRVTNVSRATKNIPVMYVEVTLRDGDRVFLLHHEFLPQLACLKPGQQVHVLTDPDVRGFFWIWEVQDENSTLLTYEQSRDHYEKSNHFPLIVATIGYACSLALSARYVWLRRRLKQNAA
jgi:hypothetical protein